MNVKKQMLKNISRIAVLSLFYLGFSFPGLAQTRVWTGGGADELASNPDNWDVGVPDALHDIVLEATSSNMTWDAGVNGLPDTVASWTQKIDYEGTVTVATVYGDIGFTEFTITGDCVISNGVWTHIANTGGYSEHDRLRVSVGGNLMIGTGGVFNVTAKGYVNSRGPGRGGRGGSYGGRGTEQYSTAGPCYGSIVAPTNLGSGGSSSGGSGGGAIIMTVSGEIKHYGIIVSDGAPISRGGSGGSVFLTAGKLSGNGLIRAHGSPGEAGGGGRIALVLTDVGADFSGFLIENVTAYGGSSGAGAGTVYLEKNGDVSGQGHLILNQGSYTALRRTVLSEVETVAYAFSKITMTNSARLTVSTNNTLTILPGTVFNTDPAAGDVGLLISSGTLAVPNDFAFSNFLIRIETSDSVFNPATSLTVGTNAVFFVDAPYAMTNNVIVAPGGLVTHTANTVSEIYKLDFTVAGNLTVQNGGGVDVTGKGYASIRGPGYLAAIGSTQGAAHGGRGGVNTGISPVPCYGSIIAPTNLGSGGGSGPGGGAMVLNVTGGVLNNGLIAADGTDGTSRRGAGGSILFSSGTLTGNGAIRAHGGSCTGTERTPGGGGRVSVLLTNASDFSGYGGSITAFSGGRTTDPTDARYSGAGTVYLRTMGQGLNEGTLIVANNDRIDTGYTDIASDVTDTFMDKIIIRDAGHLLVMTNETLTVSGVWSNAAVVEMHTDSAVVFPGTAGVTSRLYGATTFMGFYCTDAAGHTLVFDAGSTNATAAGGRLRLTGTDGVGSLNLRSSVDASVWNLNLDALTDQYVEYVDVKDSDALEGIGAEVVAINSVDNGNNFNWHFITVTPGQTNVWTGTASSNWSVRDNWSLDRAPVETDIILVPAGCPNYPALDDNRTVAGLVVEPAASISLAGYDFTITSGCRVEGSLNASATETITLEADADFTGGSFTPALSQILVAGSTAQTINAADLNFYRITVSNSSDTVTFNAGFSAVEFYCAAPAGTHSIVFQQSALFTVSERFELLGSTTATNIVLRSSSPGTSWNLAVTGYREVRGVDVRDSDASGGLPVPTDSSKDSGNNLNWVFDAAWGVWVGGVSADFHDPANWSDNVVPDSTTRVTMDSANPMTITGAVTLLELKMGGGGDVSTVTFSAPVTVTENLTVLTNSVLVINRPCTVGNDIQVFGGGLLTHDGNGSVDVNKMELAVGGNVTLYEGALLDVINKGYNGGPGSGGRGGSYGGQGTILWTTPGPCYGSVIAPTNHGSRGSYSYGGGAIIMKVSGEIRHDAAMIADGGPTSYRTGSGGTVFLTAGALTGTGSIQAHGGEGSESGGGGRISLVVTNSGSDFSGFTGSVTAYGGPSGTGAGTIYMERALDRPGHGKVLIKNLWAARMTQVPPLYAPEGETENAVFYVTKATLQLTDNYFVGDIWLESDDAVLDLGGNTLYVDVREHELTPGSVENWGEIIWWTPPPGMIFQSQ